MFCNYVKNVAFYHSLCFYCVYLFLTTISLPLPLSLILTLSVYSCALLRDILLQGRLYISRNWLCFYANLFGKDIKVRHDGA